MHLGKGEGWAGVDQMWAARARTQTHVRARSAPFSPPTMRHRGNNFGGHALTVGMNACIVCACHEHIHFLAAVS